MPEEMTSQLDGVNAPLLYQLTLYGNEYYQPQSAVTSGCCYQYAVAPSTIINFQLAGLSGLDAQFSIQQNITTCSISYQVTPESEEQTAARLKYEKEREEKRKAAEKRAEDLLLALLDDEQTAQYLADGYFDTAINDKVYRIKNGCAGNVELIVAGKAKYRYCAHPEHFLPNQDVMLSQLLMLKHDEGRFLAIANRTVLP